VKEITPTNPNNTQAESGASDWRIRKAFHPDAPEIAACVAELLIELGGAPTAPSLLAKAALALIDDREAGAVLLADHDRHIVGLLGVSWLQAIRTQGRYGLIQELWVHPAWRSQTIGADLLAALFEFAREREITRLEVGLPGERFPNLAATEAFYTNNGFQMIGTRMRRSL
jgi:GNAT superfamily N-acetyltransferase